MNVFVFCNLLWIPRRPLVIVFNDDLRWLLMNEAASAALLSELQDKRSRLFFVAVEPEESVRVGQSPPQASVAQSPPPQPAAPSGGALKLHEIFFPCGMNL